MQYPTATAMGWWCVAQLPLEEHKADGTHAKPLKLQVSDGSEGVLEEGLKYQSILKMSV